MILDGTVHKRATPLNLTIDASTETGAAPPAMRVQIVLTPKDGGPEAARAGFAAAWVARDGHWSVDIHNAFPGPEPGPDGHRRHGRTFPDGRYLVTVEFDQGEQQLGRTAPLELLLGYQRTRE